MRVGPRIGAYRSEEPKGFNGGNDINGEESIRVLEGEFTYELK